MKVKRIRILVDKHSLQKIAEIFGAQCASLGNLSTITNEIIAVIEDGRNAVSATQRIAQHIEQNAHAAGRGEVTLEETGEYSITQHEIAEVARRVVISSSELGHVLRIQKSAYAEFPTYPWLVQADYSGTAFETALFNYVNMSGMKRTWENHREWIGEDESTNLMPGAITLYIELLKPIKK